MSMVVGKRILLSILLGYSTCWLIGTIDHLPYSRVRDFFSDTMSLPGGLIAFLFFRAGVHTGRAAPLWGAMAIWGNVVFYSGLWFVAFLGIHRWRSSGSSDRAKA